MLILWRYMNAIQALKPGPQAELKRVTNPGD